MNSGIFLSVWIIPNKWFPGIANLELDFEIVKIVGWTYSGNFSMNMENPKIHTKYGNHKNNIYGEFSDFHVHRKTFRIHLTYDFYNNCQFQADNQQFENSRNSGLSCLTGSEGRVSSQIGFYIPAECVYLGLLLCFQVHSSSSQGFILSSDLEKSFYRRTRQSLTFSFMNQNFNRGITNWFLTVIPLTISRRIKMFIINVEWLGLTVIGNWLYFE